MAFLREAVPEDATAIARVHVQSWRETYGGIVPEAHLDGLSVERRAEQWRGFLADPDRGSPGAGTFVAEIPEVGIVGFADGGPSRYRQYPYSGELYAIYLLKRHQGIGIGKGLFNAVTAHLMEGGHWNMMLWVLKDNPTVSFYERHGGRIFAEQTIEIGGRTLPEVAMGYDLSP